MKKNNLLSNMGEKIKNRRIELKITQEELSKLTGYSDRSSITKIEKGKVDLTLSKLKEFAKVLKVSPEYLMGYKENEKNSNSYLMGWGNDANLSITESSESYHIFPQKKLTSVELTDIPTFGKASAGNGYINLSEEIGTYSIPKDIYKNGIFAVKVSGDSMHGFDKSIPDNSVAVVDPELCSDPINLNGKICVFEYNDETYIKQLIIDNQGIIRLHSFNPNYDDIIVLNPKLLDCKGRVIRTFVENKW